MRKRLMSKQANRDCDNSDLTAFKKERSYLTTLIDITSQTD